MGDQIMSTTELSKESMTAAAAAIPEGTPFMMLNLVRYNEQASYAERNDLPPCSGREAYLTRYVPAFAKVAALSGNDKAFKPVFLGSVLATLVGPADEPWDDVVLVQYDNLAAFRIVAESPEYERDAAPHRKAALQNWRLVAMKKQPLG